MSKLIYFILLVAIGLIVGLVVRDRYVATKASDPNDVLIEQAQNMQPLSQSSQPLELTKSDGTTIVVDDDVWTKLTPEQQQQLLSQ